MDFKCDSCGYPMEMAGAVAFSPPVPDEQPLTVRKFHICALCWVQKFMPLLSMFIVLPKRETTIEIPCQCCGKVGVEMGQKYCAACSVSEDCKRARATVDHLTEEEATRLLPQE